MKSDRRSAFVELAAPAANRAYQIADFPPAPRELSGRAKSSFFGGVVSANDRIHRASATLAVVFTIALLLTSRYMSSIAAQKSWEVENDVAASLRSWQAIMIRCLPITVLLCALLTPAASGCRRGPHANRPAIQVGSASGTNHNPFHRQGADSARRASFRRARYGRLGENARKALQAFAEAKGLAAGEPLTAEVWSALAATSSDPVITTYAIADDDVKGPFLDRLPARLDDKKDLKALAYTSPREAIAEKFHMSENCFSRSIRDRNSTVWQRLRCFVAGQS